MIDYRKRAAAVYEFDDTRTGGLPPHQKIFYGMTAADLRGIRPIVFDVEEDYSKLSHGGRRSGNPIELEYSRRRQFFNKRIMTDEEKIAGIRTALQGDCDVDSVGAQDGEGGAGCAPEATG